MTLLGLNEKYQINDTHPPKITVVVMPENGNPVTSTNMVENKLEIETYSLSHQGPFN